MTALSDDFPVLLAPVRIETRFTATEKSQTGLPPGVMRISGSRPTLPMIWILAIDAI